MALAGLVALVGAMAQGIANYNLPVLAIHVYLVIGLAAAMPPAGEGASA